MRYSFLEKKLIIYFVVFLRYDLMTMGVKHQIITSKSPQQFLQTTLNHLDSVIDMVKSESVTSLVQIAISKTIQTYSPLSTGNWMLLEQVIFSFYQGKKIKVSLFLQQNLQTVNGVLILSNNGSLPYGTERPGVIRYYEEHRLLRSDGFSTELADVCYESADVMDSSSRLGMNMYSKHPGPEQSGADAKFTPSSASKEAARLVNNAVEREIAAVTSPSHASPKRTALLSSAAGEKGSPSFRPTTQSTAKAELTLLSDLLGISSDSKADSKTEHSKFKINLFPNRAFHDSCAKAAAGGGDTDADDEDDDYAGDGSSGILILDIDATAGSKSIEDYMSALDLKDTGRGADMKAGAKGGNDDDDDLLALMDSAK